MRSKDKVRRRGPKTRSEEDREYARKSIQRPPETIAKRHTTEKKEKSQALDSAKVKCPPKTNIPAALTSFRVGKVLPHCSHVSGGGPGSAFGWPRCDGCGDRTESHGNLFKKT